MTAVAPPHDPAALVSPDTDIRISGVDEEELNQFLDNMMDLPTGAVNVLDEYEDGGYLLGEDELDTFIPAGGMEKIKSLPELLKSDPAPKAAPQLIAECLQSLPMEERENIVRDLYGIEKVEATFSGTTNHVTGEYPITTQEEEDEKFLDQKLLEMDDHLKRIRKVNAWNLKLAALELAESQNLEYTQDRRFRLKFLRCDRFDPSRAAGRLIRFFDWKLELFGEAKLTRDITLDDLTKEDRAALKKGYFQRLPVRDRAGRAITVTILNGQVYESPESIARQFFYVASTSDEETDKKGHIAVFFKVKDFTFKKCNKVMGGCFYLHRMVSDLLIRVDAFHKFLEPEQSLMHRIVDYAVNIMHPEFRSRTCLHYGKHTDWMRDLMSFGIPVDSIPLTQSYKVKNKNHTEYLSMLAKKEEMLASVPATMTADQLIDLPTRKDVLLGKGKPIQFSSGNQRLSSIIDGYLDQYHEQSTTPEKTALAAKIVQMVKANGVRFLTKESGIWIEVSDGVARDKVSHMFRHQRTKAKSKNTNASAGKVRALDDGIAEPEIIHEESYNKKVKV